MKHKTMLSLATVHQQCIADEKSQADTLQLMQDATGQSLDTCNKYFNFESSFHQQLFDEINTVLSVLDRIQPVIITEERIFKVLTNDGDVLYIKSNLSIHQVIDILEALGLSSVNSYSSVSNDYDGDLDYIIIKQ